MIRSTYQDSDKKGKSKSKGKSTLRGEVEKRSLAWQKSERASDKILKFQTRFEDPDPEDGCRKGMNGLGF